MTTVRSLRMDVSCGVGAVNALWSIDDGDLSTQLTIRTEWRFTSDQPWSVHPAKRNVEWTMEGPLFGFGETDVKCFTRGPDEESVCFAMQWLWKLVRHGILGNIPYDASPEFRQAAAELHAALLAHYAGALTRAVRRFLGRRRRAHAKVALALNLAAPRVAHVIEPLVLAWMSR